MRIKTLCVLALCLSGSAVVVAQEPKAAAPPAVSSEQPLPGLFDYENPLSDALTPPNAKPNRFWAKADYLLWWMSKSDATPLIQRIPDSLGTAASFPAGSGQTIFPGDNRLDYDSFSGVRINAGAWLNREGTWGIDVSGWYLENRDIGASYASNGSPILTRFYNDIGGSQETYLLFSSIDPANPYGGTLSASAAVSDMYNADASIRVNGYAIFSDTADYLFGMRYMSFQESLSVNGQAFLPDGRTLVVSDNYRVRNNFYGAQIGIASRWVGLYGFSLDSTLKLAVGGTSQKVSISGNNAFISPDGSVDAQNTGLWTTASNIGNYSRSQFTVIPELNLNLNYSVTDRLAIFAGYSLMAVSNVVRVSNAINTNVNESSVRYINSTQVSDAANPGFTFTDSRLWIGGWTFGIRLEY